MSLFRFLWLRKLIRKNTKPIPFETATNWTTKLSFGYMFLCWNAFGFVCYMIYNGKSDWAKYYGFKTDEDTTLTPAQQWTRTLRIKDATVYKIDGFNVSRYEVHNDFDNEETKQLNTEEEIKQ